MMNQVEIMQGELAALAHRLGLAEERLGRLAAGSGDAQVVAELAWAQGVAPADLGLSRHWPARRQLARRLWNLGWSNARVARGLGLCERTVARWRKGEA